MIRDEIVRCEYSGTRKGFVQHIDEPEIRTQLKSKNQVCHDAKPQISLTMLLGIFGRELTVLHDWTRLSHQIHR